jgi:arginyl-tRNA synthetase
VLRSAPQTIVEAVEERLGGRWNRLGEHLTQAAEAEHGDVTLASTLELVKALDHDQRELAEAIRSGVMGRPMLKGAS